MIKEIADLNAVRTPKTQGEKYQLLNDTANYIGKLMQADDGYGSGSKRYNALDGQDFLYVTIQYEKDRREEQ